MQIDEIFEGLLSKCEEYYDQDEVNLIRKAYLFGKEKHKDKKRLNGTDYMTHPLGVMEILLDMSVDASTIAASLIHETINHAGATKEEILDAFGSDVANIVATISKINRLELTDDSEYSAMNLRKVLVGMSEDIRVLFLKLADRLHNLRTADALNPEDRKRKVNETMTVLIPIAHRLGMYKIKGEMEDLCLKYSKPDVYEDILERLNATEKELKTSLEEMEESISEMLTEQNIPFRIKSRVKSVYSIYNKLNNGKTWEKIYDILALRVIVEKVSECYLTVGLIHAKYRPIPGRFKDYIAMPKQNMYQSLHTGVFGPDGHKYEVQIRTEEMDEFAEKGVAAHFAYKEKHQVIKNIMEQKLEIFRNLIESSDHLSDIEFESDVKSDLLNDSIYVFTPKGDVLELPKGATPIDFAYRIHTDVGDKTVGAIVNDTIVPLNYELSNNDVVKIKTSNTGTPNKEWLSFVKTSHAKNKIKAYFSKQEKEVYTERGKTILNNELRKRKMSFETVLSNETVKTICNELKLQDLDDLYFSIGTLRYTAAYILSLATEEKRDVHDVLLEKVLAKSQSSTKKNYKSDVLVNNEENIMVSLAKCCHPVRGDEIVGFVTKGEGVSVHRKDCPNLKNETERLIDVEWNVAGDNTYYAIVTVVCEMGKNYLLDIIGKATSKDVYVDAVKTKEKDNETIYELTVKMKNRDALENFMDSLKAFKFIKEVKRK